MAAYAYLLYALGFITPYVRAEFGVSDAVAALPNSLSAVGVAVAGFVVGGVAVRFGARGAARFWILVMAATGVALATRVSLPVVLGAAFAFGLTSGGVLVHVNSSLGGGGGGRAETHLVRANLWAVVGAVLAPLAIASTQALGLGWAIGLLVPVPVLVAISLVLPSSPARDVAPTRVVGRGCLEPSGWSGSSSSSGSASSSPSSRGARRFVALRTGSSVDDATRLGSLFVAGMLTGRLVLSSGFGAGRRSRAILASSLGLAACGALVVWLATAREVAGAGLFLGGLGVSSIYPIGVGLALALTPDTPILASTRLTLASGLAIFGAPLVLGVVAQLIGIGSGWLLVPALAGTALVALSRIPRVTVVTTAERSTAAVP